MPFKSIDILSNKIVKFFLLSSIVNWVFWDILFFKHKKSIKFTKLKKIKLKNQPF